MRNIVVFIAICLGVGVVAFDAEAAAATPSPAKQQLETNKKDIAAKQAEIEALEKKIEELSTKRDSAAAQTEIAEQQVARLEQTLQKHRLEMRQTQLHMSAVNEDRADTEKSVEQLEVKIAHTREQLRELVRTRYQHEQQSPVSLFLQGSTLGAVLAEQAALREVQDQMTVLVNETQVNLKDLQERQEKLAGQAQELSRLSAVLEVQNDEFEERKHAKEKLAAAKEREQQTYEQDIREAQMARREIEQSVFSLKSAGIQMKLTDAFSIARHASTLTGVRPAVLLAILKVESNLGERLGSGHFPTDMHPSSREAFLRITKKLGLDPNHAPISARPRSYSGWGGAMGPGQFMPETWETIEARVAGLMNKPVANPYELVDAFVATGMLLADRGANEASKEYEAVNRYLAGPNWQYFTWYGDRVLTVAKEYEKEGVI